MRIASRQRTLIDSNLKEDQLELIKVRDAMQKLYENSYDNDSEFEPIIKMPNKKLTEDYARGIPDFALSQVASDAAEDLKSHIRRHILQTTKDPSEQRRRFASAQTAINELESDLKQLLEDKLTKFIRST